MKSAILLTCLFLLPIAQATPPGGTNYLAPPGQFNGVFDTNQTTSNCYRGSNTNCGTAFDHGPTYCSPCTTVSDGTTSLHYTSLGSDYDTIETTGMLFENDDPVHDPAYIPGNVAAHGCGVATEANTTDQWSQAQYFRFNSGFLTNPGRTLHLDFKMIDNLTNGGQVCVGVLGTDSTFTSKFLYDTKGFTAGQEIKTDIPISPDVVFLELTMERTDARTSGNTSTIGLTLLDWQLQGAATPAPMDTGMIGLFQMLTVGLGISIFLITWIRSLWETYKPRH